MVFTGKDLISKVLDGKYLQTFVRRAISRNWKSNTGSSVLEQTHTSERFFHFFKMFYILHITNNKVFRHRDWLKAVCSIVGDMQILSLDILVSKEGIE